jgi:hypothetical protein
MTLNPITALSEQLQKLINEHGSASILRDHLALFKDKVLLLENENINFRSENVVLVSKIEVLQTKNDELTKDNEKLRSKIQQYEQPNHTVLLDPMQVGILKLLFVQDRLTIEQVAIILKIKPQEAKFHLTELLNLKPPYLHIAASIGEPQSWYLSQEGRRYVMENKLTSQHGFQPDA